MSSIEADVVSISPNDRDRLLAIVEEACRPIGPYWPMKTFAYYNPLRDLEHLPFSDAVGAAKHLLGAKGFLPPEDYRRLFHQGRISQTSLEHALRRVGPSVPTTATIQVGARTIHVSDVWLIHLLYGIEPLNPVLFTWTIEVQGANKRFRFDLPEESKKRIIDRTIRECERCRHDPEGTHLTNLWKSALSAFHLVDPVSEDSFHTDTDREGASEPADISHHTCPIDLPAGRTIGDWLDTLTDEALVDAINNQLIKWITAFVDEGVAGWSMPSREKGFYAAWRMLVQEDQAGSLLGIRRIRDKVQRLPDNAEDALLTSLHKLAIPVERWHDYLARHLAQLPGWAGFVRWRGNNPGYPAQHHHPVDPVQYLAVRVFYESELVDVLVQREWAIEGTLTALKEYWSEHEESYWATVSPSSHVGDPNTEGVCAKAWRLFHLAQFLELTPLELNEATGPDIATLLEWIDLFPAEAHGPVWLEAYEDTYRQHLLKRILEHQGAVPQAGGRPRAQGIFCIDARSEPFRRHLEAQGPYETFGYAGFFGVPMSYVGFDSHDHLALCPILLTPKAEVLEVPRSEQHDAMKEYLSGSRWLQLGQQLTHDLKQNPISSFILIEVLGLFYSVGLMGKTLFRVSYDTIKNWLLHWLGKPVRTEIPVDRPGERKGDSLSPSALLEGFTIEEQAAFVGGGLQIIGLVSNFGRFVLVSGHGSQSDNNPYFAALDCGACGGSHGDPNARVFAAMANNPEVRRILDNRGLTIPDDCWFLPAKHNTTTDRVSFYDLSDLPPGHRAELALLAKDLEEAGASQALERCHRIPAAPTDISPRKAFAHVRERSIDWANPRPEWGLSGNAAFLIGRRAITKGLNLGGRVFLHSYDPHTDPEGGLLEKIMTAPLIVGELISLTYYFSAVDPWGYGSGSKVIHNVIGGIGVMLGSQSDLQKGLPLQSVNDGARHYHEPMRLLAIIEAPEGRIASIIDKHALLQHLFQNGWMNLLAYDQALKTFSRYRSDATWEPVTIAP